MSEERHAVDPLSPEEFQQVPEHLEDDGPAETALTAAKPGGPLRFARMVGASIAGRDAAAWVTDFLNAAYYRRPVPERDVDDVRLASCVLTTFWYRKERGGRRLRLTDLGAFHRAFGGHRFDTELSGRGLLTREQLLGGAAGLVGDWFPHAYADDTRRGWGIAFPTAEERAAYDPEARMRLARLGELTPESAPPERQTWHTYPPVEMPSAEAVVDALTRPETWPDYASEIGRFTPLRAGGLEGQTFEIDVVAGTESGRPIFTRGYVTITQLVTPADPAALQLYFAELADGMARYGDGEPQPVPEGGEPLVGFDLTTHQGHFMGSGHNRLILYMHDDRAWVRAVGTWDPMPWHVDQAYRRAGQAAQHAFWGQGNVERLSMLHQLANQIA
ncbi:MAG TPA: hypothetical protein VME22_28425 [Solirubrobacteraceae bacterium]|nr:hypothetical protein [Solirubrobacteraceae bacterium]